jgi:membrane-associated protease RseP (regulator of RpoE activity)
LNGYALALIAFLAYLLMVAVGRRARLWKRFDVAFYGPVLLLKTRRGRGAIARLASHRRFFSIYGTLSTVITLSAMFVLTGLIIWEVYTTARGLPTLGVDSGATPAPSETDLFSVLVFFVIGLGIAVLVHEFMHGVMSEAGKIKIESMGILLFLIPIGAFVESNDSELKAAPRSKRLRLYASGPATNIVVAVVLTALLVGVLGPSATPIKNGAAVVDVAAESPADVSGIRPWSLVTGVGGHSISNVTDFSSVTFDYPGELTSVNLTLGGRDMMMALPGGIVVTSVTDGPAFNAGVEPGMILAALDDRIIHSLHELTSVIENTTNEEPVNVTVLKFGHDTTAGVSWFVRDEQVSRITLTTKWIYYYTHIPSQNRESYKNVSFMGASFSPFGLAVRNPEELLQTIARPLAGANGAGGLAKAIVNYVAMPYVGSLPMVPPASDLYGPSGALSFMPHDIYWTLFNLVYWTFWANLMLGLTNALPAIPMDGAFVLRDALKGLAKKAGERMTGFDLLIGRRPISDKSVDRIMIGVTVAIFAMVAYLVLWQVHGPLF